MKAFLSHSSSDKEFVRAVATELGRQFCIFDEQTFSTGKEFKRSIEKGLNDSSLFVLFASRAALKSAWVDFELNEAWMLRLVNKLPTSLVYIIESSVTTRDLPEWLQRALVRRETSAKLVARDIKFHIDELLKERQHSIFIGRSKSVEELEQALTPIDTSLPPRFVFVTGLPGVGRRALIRHSVPTILSLRKQIEIRLGEGDSVNDICITLADHVEPFASRTVFENMIGQLRQLSDEAALERIRANLLASVAAGELPIFLDEGGVLDEEGYLRDPVRAIVHTLAPDDDVYIFVVSPRRPRNELDLAVPFIHLGPLGLAETKRLISILADKIGVEISPSNLSTLATGVAGYPPAAYFAIQQAKYYGLELVVGQQKRLTQFRTSVFLRYLSRLAFNDSERNILCLLASYSPLPLPVISITLSVDSAAIYDNLIRLIDLSLIFPTEDGYYRIADPIADAAVEAFGFPTQAQSKDLATNLLEFIQNADIKTSRVELSRVIFRAALIANDTIVAQSVIHLANDLIRLTETLYHERRYDESEQFGYAALNERPSSISARSYLIRALIQNEKWEEAEAQIRELQKYAPIRDVHFLRGFLERKRGNIPAAVNFYLRAEQSGKTGAALSRELALSHFLIGNLESAERYVKEALKRFGDNPFVVDLWIKIAVSRRDEASARDGLSRLELLDKRRYYQHRLSTVDLSFGHVAQALSAARLAAQGTEPPPFEVIAHLIHCEIESGNLLEAEKLLVELDRRFERVRRDFRITLRCRLEIARGRFSDALILSEGIIDKSTVYYKRLRHDALVGEITSSVLQSNLRLAYEDEIARLNEQLSGTIASPLLVSELGPFT